MEGMQLDSQLCQQCRGRCCQGHPGVWVEPKRFFAIFSDSSIPSAAKLGQILTINRLTLRDLGGVLIPAPLNTEQGCIAQQENGCGYPTATRPCQCLALIPNLETLIDDLIHCSLPPAFGSGSARENWRPFQDLLSRTDSPKNSQ